MTLAVHDIEAIHNILVEWFANTEDPVSPPGVRDRPLLESAAARPDHTVGQKPAYTDEFERAAALFHSLINNHPFHNGNKRACVGFGASNAR
jgi:death on curing protein